MKCKTTETPELYKLEEMVNEMLGDGWEPQGGLCSTKYGTSTYYSQAMIKHDEFKMNAQDDTSRDLLSLMTIASKYK